jgi:hypothetical protein
LSGSRAILLSLLLLLSLSSSLLLLSIVITCHIKHFKVLGTFPPIMPLSLKLKLSESLSSERIFITGYVTVQSEKTREQEHPLLKKFFISSPCAKETVKILLGLFVFFVNRRNIFHISFASSSEQLTYVL